MRQTFNDISLQKEFESNGFVVVGLLQPEDITGLHQYFLDHKETTDTNFFTTIWLKDKDHRREVNDHIRSIVYPRVNSILKNHKTVFANYMVKLAGEQSAIGMHQDWSFVDEAKFRAVNVWTPLVDTNPVNGALQLVKHSHAMSNHLRGRNIVSPLEKIYSFIQEKFLTTLNVNKGQAVIFDSNLIHASEDNRSDHDRVATSLVLAPEEAQLIHYYKLDQNGGPVFKANVESDFFHEYGYFDDLSKLEYVEQFDHQTEDIGKMDFRLRYLKHKLF